jgi:hypothetical protein
VIGSAKKWLLFGADPYNALGRTGTGPGPLLATSGRAGISWFGSFWFGNFAQQHPSDVIMSGHQDIDHVLRDWPFQPGMVSSRLVRAGANREVVQMRIDMGVLQMELSNRPDGERPGGMDTYLDYLVRVALHEGDAFELTEERTMEIDREFMQFYHRRICLLGLRQFRRAVGDADHTLMLMDFVGIHSSDREWVASHERYRPFVLFQRTQASALAELEDSGPEAAIEAIDNGVEMLRLAQQSWDDDESDEDDEMSERLAELKEWIRKHYQLGRTLGERLADAVATEQYELAARLRDEIARRRSKSC